MRKYQQFKIEGQSYKITSSSKNVKITKTQGKTEEWLLRDERLQRD